MIGNELFKLDQELQFGEGKEPYPWEHNGDLCPFKILENQEMQMSQELLGAAGGGGGQKWPSLLQGSKRKPSGKTKIVTEGPEALERAILIPLFISTERNDTSQLCL